MMKNIEEAYKKRTELIYIERFETLKKRRNAFKSEELLTFAERMYPRGNCQPIIDNPQEAK
jgi:hypothetical protein